MGDFQVGDWGLQFAGSRWMRRVCAHDSGPDGLHSSGRFGSSSGCLYGWIIGLGMELWTKSVKLARLHCGKDYCKYDCRGSEKV